MWAWLSLLDICIEFALMNTCRACCPPREQLHAPSSHCGGSDCWAGKLPGGSWEDWPKCECERSGLHTAKYMRWESKSSIYNCWKWHGACLHFFVKDLIPPISGVLIAPCNMEAWPFFILQSPRIPKQPAMAAMATCQVLMATFVIGALMAMLRRYRQTQKAAFELDDSNSRKDGL